VRILLGERSTGKMTSKRVALTTDELLSVHE
jgi:hypothetical protein